ncbi:hypothetical protein ASZ78_017078 [Callipepla squamata]|uniref:RNA 3'-terminal phosphate cyclase domain-containing protein n=1 Tax=Callipepla squamata TaxID=9009 RepID=A0A226N5N1_CALSU|nr:hypothetical protein ASZ78_017078 [Callipepla squamata]
MAGGGGQCLSYAGCNFLRQRLVLSTLSGRPLKIRKIRAKEEDPGLRGVNLSSYKIILFYSSDFEACFIRLIDKVTNGSRIEINQTGTTLYYQPGLLYGGSLEHDCSPSRSIGYYLESLLCLAPFMKHPLKIVLRGVTNDQVDPSVDVLKATALPLLKKFGIDGESLEIKINRRGMPPKGGGEILFTCPVRKVLQPIQFTDPGKIKRIRGTAYPSLTFFLNKSAFKGKKSPNLKSNSTPVLQSIHADNTGPLFTEREHRFHHSLAQSCRYSVRVSPQMANRMVESARSILNKFLPDIYIYTDHMKGVSSGKSPGFGICLIAETINGTILSAELASNPQGQGAAVLPEDLGQNCAKLLLEEIYRVSGQYVLCVQLKGKTVMIYW